MRATWFVIFLSASAPAVAGYQKDLGIRHDPQDKDNTCGVAVAKMWVNWLHATTHSELTIENRGNAMGYKLTGAGSDGMQAGEMPRLLEEFSSHWFNRDTYTSSSSMTTTMVRQINAGKPVAVLGFTRYTDGRAPRPNGHWLLVDAFRNSTTAFSSTSTNVEGFWLQDPMHNGRHGAYATTSPSTFVSRNDFFTVVASKSGTEYNLAKDGW
jgi:hypothetical protein